MPENEEMLLYLQQIVTKESACDSDNSEQDTDCDQDISNAILSTVKPEKCSLHQIQDPDSAQVDSTQPSATAAVNNSSYKSVNHTQCTSAPSHHGSRVNL